MLILTCEGEGDDVANKTYSFQIYFFIVAGRYWCWGTGRLCDFFLLGLFLTPESARESTAPQSTGTQPAARGAGSQNASLMSWRGQEADMWMGGTTRIQSVGIGGIWIHWHTEDFIRSYFNMFVVFCSGSTFAKVLQQHVVILWQYLGNKREAAER